MRRLLAITLVVAFAPGAASAASLMPPGKQVYLDNSGNPLSGGKVYTYAAGTSTPLATYSDQAGAVPNANPVVLNSRGEATIFWGAGPYKVTLRTSADALLWTQDNMYPPFTAAEPLKLYSGGNATTPELTWTDDINSGLYLIGPDNIGLSLNGTGRCEWTTTAYTCTGIAATFGTVSGTSGTFSSSVTMNGGDLNMTRAATQWIAKTNGQLSLGTSDANTLDLITTNTSRLTIGAAGGIDVHSQRISNVTDPSAAQDAATKAYVDALSSSTVMAAGTDWTLNTNAVGKTGNVVAVSLVATAGASSAWTVIATVPSGYRPAAGVISSCLVNDSSPGTQYVGFAFVNSDGTVELGYYDNGTAVVTPFTIGSSDSIRCAWAYPVP